MSYGLDLVRLPPDVNPETAYRKQSEEKARKLAQSHEINAGPIDPKKEEAKRALADALVARHPSLRLSQPNFAERARLHGIALSEAKRRFRDLELNEEQYWIQIFLFDDTAGASFSFSGSPQECTKALRLLWDCLEILASQGGFSVYDSQVGRVLNLSTDFELVLKNACGVDRDMG